ncbi:MAG TPA: hypothetical protein VJM50_08160 [Pyrinomonadaceae bacterium]|nr:hypothetical protein [Pyrinomonadaceae bacterium]
MRLKILFLAVAVLASTTEVLAQDRSSTKDPQYYHFLMENCPGKNLKVTLKDGQKLSGICQAQLVDRVQISREGVTHDIPYTNIAKMNINRSWFGKCFGKVKETASATYFYVYLVGAMFSSRDQGPW